MILISSICFHIVCLNSENRSDSLLFIDFLSILYFSSNNMLMMWPQLENNKRESEPF